MIILGISGKRGSGKTTLAEILVRDYKWIHTPFAQSLKDLNRKLLGLTYDETDGVNKERPLIRFPKPNKYMGSYIVDEGYWTPREIMISTGQFFRSIDPLFWVKKTFENIKQYNDDYEHSIKYADDRIRFVISDVRFKNEAEYIKSKNGLLCRLERDENLNIFKTKLDDPSETELDNYRNWDVHVSKFKNETIKDLEITANEINKLATEHSRRTV